MSRFVAVTVAVLAWTAIFVHDDVIAGPPPYENADIDQNGYVNSIDMGLLVAGTHPRADVNRDGKINSLDFGFVAANYGPVLRNKYKQPFASTSIWNTAIGTGAVYEDTDFQLSRDYTVIDVDHWVVTSEG
jgi:hypothetical protein